MTKQYIKVTQPELGECAVSTKNTFEIHGLDGEIWVRPYVGNDEFNGETYDTLADALDALPMFARELGWDDYNTTIAELAAKAALAPSTVDVGTVTEYGLTQKLSNPIRCF